MSSVTDVEPIFGAPDRRHLDLDAFDRELRQPSTPTAESWEPWLVRLGPQDVEGFHELCREADLTSVDAIDTQLDELAAVRLPGGSRTARERLIDEEIGRAGGREAYGCRVFLPWEGRVFHLLDEEEYLAVVTDRNHDKITAEEQRRLRGMCVGVVGLSVGGEAAVTIAQEHLCGHLVLADFDTLDLSNLNRLGAGFDELGLNKAVLVARRIARLDPYLRVTVLRDGVTEGNLHGFLDGLDLLLEECDDLPLKHRIRVRARAQGLNVVFAGDERGFLSVEPYGTHPELLPFHGRVTESQGGRESYPTTQAFWVALAEWLGGWDAISQRSRDSLRQIGETVSGYPQLASEARYAAGQVGHVARRLLLGEEVPPFVGHLDLEELLEV